MSKYTISMQDVVSHLCSLVEESTKPKAPENSFSIIGISPKAFTRKGIRKESAIKKLPKEGWQNTERFLLTDHAGRTWFPTREQAVNSAIIALSEREWLLDVEIVENN